MEPDETAADPADPWDADPWDDDDPDYPRL